MSDSKPNHLLPNADATRAFGRVLAPYLQAGDVLLLSGDLGTGKTEFARAVIQARLAVLGRAEDVPSPSFTLVQTYDVGDVEIWHADLYRLSGPDDVYELGLDDAMTDAICLIEWPERLGDDIPAGAVWLRLAHPETGDGRLLMVDPMPGSPARLVSALEHALDTAIQGD